MRRPTIVLAAGLSVSACGPGTSRVAAVGPSAPAPSIASSVVGGATDGLAVELLLAGAAPFPWHSGQVAEQDRDIALALDAIALDHLRSAALGAGTGPLLLGSATIRNLAAASNAPADQNGNGTNLDETLRRETERIAAFAGTSMREGTHLPLLPWRTRSAELSAPLAVGPDPHFPWRTGDLGDATVQMAEVGRFLQLRAIASRRLLLAHHRGRYGSTADEGTLGLLAMQQLLAAEHDLFARLFTSGGPLGELPDPATYDPGIAPHWLPSEIAVELDPGVTGAPTGYRTRDGASDLMALASLLQAATELIRVTDPGATFALPELFRGRPFAPPAPTPVPPSLSWSRDIAPLLTFRCGACHFLQTFGGFSITSYESMLLGGNKTRQFNLTFIAPGNPLGSQLHRILTGPQAPFFRMPFGQDPLQEAEIARIDAWIDGGALRDPPVAPAPPQPGEDLARVSFRNLVALHFDATTGLLHHRHEGEGPSGVATALSTGQVLQALAALDRAAPGLEFRGWTPFLLLARLVEGAARLVDGEGRCADSFGLVDNVPSGAADLRAQAAMTAGLLAAATRLGPGNTVHDLAARATAFLLTAFVDPATQLFARTANGAASTYAASELTDLLAALRFAVAAGVPGAAERRTLLLQRLRPVLAFAEWGGHGEVLGDGIADTDGDGLREPAAAGGLHGRLPLLGDRFVVAPAGPGVDRPITWSLDVRPLLLSKCGECHMNGNERGLYHLDTRQSLTVAGESLGVFPMLVPGDPENSLLFLKISRRQPPIGMQMPFLRPPLDELSTALIRRWILEGATSR